MSATASPFPFNDLPLELQREIFVAAADLHPGSALRLVLVARKVYSWIQPLIYETVVLGTTDTALFLRTMDTLPIDFLALHVRNLCLSVSVGARDALKILRTCTAVEDLAFWINGLDTRHLGLLVSAINNLALQRLSIEVMHFRRLLHDIPTGSARWIDNLTHLDLIFWTHENSPLIPHLDRLPLLTHLSLRLLHSHVDEEAIHVVLRACRHLRIMVLFDASEMLEETVWHADPRVVYLAYPLTPVREWEEQVKRSLNNTWALAEELVRRHAIEQAASAPAQ
ncbi:hypothetical protein CVT24_000296 [Panaeolus cyanescens]|uniref:F-box domain-containing protein n=1 Tax=Panaeolus cyanescens TaxID=181874 RepID=A0A409W3B4_9AGAR|nr:hypothetical protein CVT24_000296 [Panaeolus cyanescens]